MNQLRPIIYPYKMWSTSARLLSASLSDVGSKRVRERGYYHPTASDLIVNWGNPRMPKWANDDVLILNNPKVVQTTFNKLLSLEKMKGTVRIPKFTTLMEDAIEWIRNGRGAVARTILSGHGGKGILLVNDEDELPDCTLYTRYVKKSEEYRVHVFNNSVIFLQKKLLRNGSEGNNFQIRNYANGWIFGSKDISVPQDVVEQSLLAIQTLELDFGAVDVGWNDRYQKAFVYEVNTAPALEGTTLQLYSQYLRRLL